MYEPLEKPPLGLMPRSVWDRNRITLIQEAMLRYLDEGKEVPNEWLRELLELLDRYYGEGG